MRFDSKVQIFDIFRGQYEIEPNSCQLINISTSSEVTLTNWQSSHQHGETGAPAGGRKRGPGGRRGGGRRP